MINIIAEIDSISFLGKTIWRKACAPIWFCSWESSADFDDFFWNCKCGFERRNWCQCNNRYHSIIAVKRVRKFWRKSKYSFKPGAISYFSKKNRPLIFYMTNSDKLNMQCILYIIIIMIIGYKIKDYPLLSQDYSNQKGPSIFITPNYMNISDIDDSIYILSVANKSTVDHDTNNYLLNNYDQLQSVIPLMMSNICSGKLLHQVYLFMLFLMHCLFWQFFLTFFVPLLINFFPEIFILNAFFNRNDKFC